MKTASKPYIYIYNYVYIQEGFCRHNIARLVAGEVCLEVVINARTGVVQWTRLLCSDPQ